MLDDHAALVFRFVVVCLCRLEHVLPRHGIACRAGLGGRVRLGPKGRAGVVYGRLGLHLVGCVFQHLEGVHRILDGHMAPGRGKVAQGTVGPFARPVHIARFRFEIRDIPGIQPVEPRQVFQVVPIVGDTGHVPVRDLGHDEGGRDAIILGIGQGIGNRLFGAALDLAPIGEPVFQAPGRILVLVGHGRATGERILALQRHGRPGIVGIGHAQGRRQHQPFSLPRALCRGRRGRGQGGHTPGRSAALGDKPPDRGQHVLDFTGRFRWIGHLRSLLNHQDHRVFPTRDPKRQMAPRIGGLCTGPYPQAGFRTTDR